MDSWACGGRLLWVVRSCEMRSCDRGEECRKYSVILTEPCIIYTRTHTREYKCSDISIWLPFQTDVIHIPTRIICEFIGKCRWRYCANIVKMNENAWLAENASKNASKKIYDAINMMIWRHSELHVFDYTQLLCDVTVKLTRMTSPSNLCDFTDMWRHGRIDMPSHKMWLESDKK